MEKVLWVVAGNGRDEDVCITSAPLLPLNSETEIGSELRMELARGKCWRPCNKCKRDVDVVMKRLKFNLIK